MRIRTRAALALAAAPVAAAWIGCAPLPDGDCNAQHTCPPSDAGVQGVRDATSDAEAGALAGGDARTAEAGAPAEAGDGSSCDGASAPSADPCVIGEGYGVFVSPLGADGNAGTRAAPVLTIGRGMDLAKAAGKRVYVCAGAFEEGLVVDASRDGVNVFGGFDCGTWTYNTANRVTVSPSQPGYALEVEQLVEGVDFQDLEFDAPRAPLANPGQSSIAVFVRGSLQVTFERVTMVAGNATDGKAGASGQGHGDGGANNGATNWYGTPPGYSELNGKVATNAAAGTQNVCMCGDATSSTGGPGGAGPADGGRIPGPGLPLYGSDAGAGTPGTDGKQCAAGGGGLAGADGPVASATPGDGSWGMISATGWTPVAGVTGSDGEPGQGGGGGGNGPAGMGGGGGGACGGCGGAGGNGGSGGGSSVGLLSYQSAITLIACTLTASNAGNGGAGGNGEAGQAGSFIGGNGIVGGCPGGGGGSGAGGSGGQGGPGGLSLGIGYAGTAPIFDGNPVSPGQALPRVLVGHAGAAGTIGLAGPAAAANVGEPQAGADGPAGLAGIAQAVLSL